MEKFTTLTGVAAPLVMDDVNTDQIAPVAMQRGAEPDYAAALFGRWREDPAFVLNKPQFRAARILVARNNFGCGSSRESAVWALLAWGISCVVARSFADIFRENCLKNGLLPVTLPDAEAQALETLVVEADGARPFTADLERQVIVCPDGREIAFAIAASERRALIEGLDDIGLTLEHGDEIAAWERRAAAGRPWLQQAAERR